MRTATAVSVAALAGLAVAAPTHQKRQVVSIFNATQNVDPTILQFALALEHLEDNFYQTALKKFSADDFAKAGFTGARNTLVRVGADESQHVTLLTGALSAAGASPVAACASYPFDSLLTDVKTFLSLSQIIEGVGVSAYLGAAGAISDPTYTTVAGSILTVEARHNAFVRLLNGYSVVPAPEDTPVSPAGIVTMVTPFLGGCSADNIPAISGHPNITVGKDAPRIGSNVQLAIANQTVAQSASNGTYCAFLSGVTPTFSEYQNGTCKVPENTLPGQVYVVITRQQGSVTDANVLAGPAFIELDTANNTAVSVNSTGNAGASADGASSPANGGSDGKSAASALTIPAAALSVVLGAFALLF